MTILTRQQKVLQEFSPLHQARIMLMLDLVYQLEEYLSEYPHFFYVKWNWLNPRNLHEIRLHYDMKRKQVEEVINYMIKTGLAKIDPLRQIRLTPSGRELATEAYTQMADETTMADSGEC